MFKKIVVAGFATAVLMVPMAGVASAAPEPDQSSNAGWKTDGKSKRLCKVPTNWFERNILQMPDFTWERCFK